MYASLVSAACSLVSPSTRADASSWDIFVFYIIIILVDSRKYDWQPYIAMHVPKQMATLPLDISVFM